MIHVVELPPQQAPKAWFAFDADDFLRKVAGVVGREPWTIWDRTSARELLEMFDTAPERPEAKGAHPALYSLGERHGWDTPLYRADDVLGAGVLQTEPVDVVQACVVALQPLGHVHVYSDDAAAMAAFERGDAEFPSHGWRARWALRQQLIEMEVLADDT